MALTCPALPMSPSAGLERPHLEAKGQLGPGWLSVAELIPFPQARRARRSGATQEGPTGGPGDQEQLRRILVQDGPARLYYESAHKLN